MHKAWMADWSRRNAIKVESFNFQMDISIQITTMAIKHSLKTDKLLHAIFYIDTHGLPTELDACISQLKKVKGMGMSWILEWTIIYKERWDLDQQ